MVSDLAPPWSRRWSRRRASRLRFIGAKQCALRYFCRTLAVLLPNPRRGPCRRRARLRRLEAFPSNGAASALWPWARRSRQRGGSVFSPVLSPYFSGTPRTGRMGLRRCLICGAALEDMRADALYCSTAHRVEAWRLRRLLAGEHVGPYRTVADRMAAFGRPRRPSRYTNAEEPHRIDGDNIGAPAARQRPGAGHSEVAE
jgi:hypothetical protein